MRAQRLETVDGLSDDLLSENVRRCNKQRAFTLIEILVVIVILSILGGLAAQTLLSRPDAARVQAAQTDLRTLAAALDVYRLDNYRYPSSDQGLQALVERPNGSPEPKNYNPGGYLKKLPEDPWGSPYLYESADGRVELLSLGADGIEGGEGNDADIRLSEL